MGRQTLLTCGARARELVQVDTAAVRKVARLKPMKRMLCRNVLQRFGIDHSGHAMTRWTFALKAFGGSRGINGGVIAWGAL